MKSIVLIKTLKHMVKMFLIKINLNMNKVIILNLIRDIDLTHLRTKTNLMKKIWVFFNVLCKVIFQNIKIN